MSLTITALDSATCKAARALLDWTAAQLCDASGVPVDTLRSFESGRTKALSRANESAILSAFMARGVQFIEAGQIAQGAGVALKAPE